jgi:hypothetical protein
MQIGGMTFNDMAHRMMYSEFRQWMRYFKEEPFGGPWENFLMAQQNNLLTQIHFKKPIAAHKFMYRRRTKSAKVETQKQQLAAFVGALDSRAVDDGN